MGKANAVALTVLVLICTLLVNSNGYGWNSDYYKRYWDNYYQPSQVSYQRYQHRPNVHYDRYRPPSSTSYDRYYPDTMISYDRYRQPYPPYHDTRSNRYGYNCREGYGYGYECYDDVYGWYPSVQSNRRYPERRYGDYNYDPYRDYYDLGWDRKTVTADSKKVVEPNLK